MVRLWRKVEQDCIARHYVTLSPSVKRQKEDTPFRMCNKNPSTFSCTSQNLIVPLALPKILRLGCAIKNCRHFFLHISKLNRTSGFAEGTSSWMCDKNPGTFSCTSQNLIVPLHAIYNNKVYDFCSRVYTT